MDCYSSMAVLFKALGDSNRLRILFCLLDAPSGSLTVSELVEILGISQPLTSHHLKELKHAGILISRRRGPFIHYEVMGEDIVPLLHGALGVVSSLAGQDVSDLKEKLERWKERYGKTEN